MLHRLKGLYWWSLLKWEESRFPFPAFLEGTKQAVHQAKPMIRSPLVRRVSIYLVLSTAAVTGVNMMDLNQSAKAPFYIPLFIGIYILSRWIDSQLEQKNSPPDVVNTTEDTGSISNPRGFKS